MGRSGYDISGFYEGGGSSNPNKQLTQQKKPTSDDPTMPKESKPSKKTGKAPAKPSPPPRSSPGPSSSAGGSGRASQPQPPAKDKGDSRFIQYNSFGSQVNVGRFISKNQPPPLLPPPGAIGKAAKGKEKKSHRFSPFARPPNPKETTFSVASPPPPPPPALPPMSFLPSTSKAGDLWESAKKLSIRRAVRTATTTTRSSSRTTTAETSGSTFLRTSPSWGLDSSRTGSATIPSTTTIPSCSPITTTTTRTGATYLCPT